jgi:hypothetical protein
MTANKCCLYPFDSLSGNHCDSIWQARSTILQVARKTGLEAKYRYRMQEFNLTCCPQVTILWNSTGRTDSGKSKNWSPRPELRLAYWLPMCKTVIRVLSLHATSVIVMQHANVPDITRSTYRNTLTSSANTAQLYSIYFIYFYFI